MSKDIENPENSERTYEIRIVLRPDSKKDKQTYDYFKEMMEYHHPIDPSPLAKMLLNKAYEKWFIPDIKKKSID